MWRVPAPVDAGVDVGRGPVARRPRASMWTAGLVTTFQEVVLTSRVSLSFSEQSPGAEKGPHQQQELLHEMHFSLYGQTKLLI